MMDEKWMRCCKSKLYSGEQPYGTEKLFTNKEEVPSVF